MSWFNDLIDSPANILQDIINPKDSTGSALADYSRTYAASRKKLVASERGRLLSRRGDVESSIFDDALKKFSAMEATGEYGQLESIMSQIETGFAAQTAAREKDKINQNIGKGRTSTLLGGDRFEQLLTSAKMDLQQQKPKTGTLLTANTITATSAKT